VTTTEPSTDEVTPLAEVERAVQARAKDIALDMGTPAGRAALKELIRDELARWDDDVRRGRRTFPLTNPDIVARRAWRNLAEYGPLTDLLG
jgi:pilus assembly protein CpaF